MKRLINICLLLSFMLAYLEWGTNRHTFIFQTEAELFSKTLVEPGAFLHPLILLPLCGQIMLLFTLFQRNPGKILTLTGLACLSMLILLLLFVGLISFNWKIILSVIPFIITGILAIRQNRKQQKKHGLDQSHSTGAGR